MTQSIVHKVKVISCPECDSIYVYANSKEIVCRHCGHRFPKPFIPLGSLEMPPESKIIQTKEDDTFKPDEPIGASQNG